MNGHAVVIARVRKGPAGDTQMGNVVANGFSNAKSAYGSIRRVAQNRRVQPEDLAVFKDGVHVPHPDSVVSSSPMGVPALA
jgi:hypothetical protein